MQAFFVYLLRCADGSYYCGHTDDMAERMRQHAVSDTGHLATRKRVELVWQGEFETRAGAIEFEQQVKGWSRAKKEALIEGDWERIKVLARGGAPRAGLSAPGVSTLRGVDGSPSTGSGRTESNPAQVPRSDRAEPVEAPVSATSPSTGSGRTGGDPARVHTSVRAEPVEAPAPGTSPSTSSGRTESTPARAEPVEASASGTSPSTSSGRTESTPVRAEPVEAPSISQAHRILHADPLPQRRAIAKAITLLESTRADHRARADELLTALLPHTGRSFRLGISGVPGVGKSTFIEALGLHLIGQGHRVAVLTIDPSSTVSGGSILGDKTRMEQLSVHERAYIRPSPSSGTLGGVAEKTREAMLVCEAAGYDVVIVETVGVGQSETAVANMTDMFVLMQLPNAGDDLQAIKKGVMELADLVVINKADIDANAAMRAAAQITSAMRLFGLVNNAMGAAQAEDFDKQWHPQVLQISALRNQGVDAFWAAVTQFRTLQSANGRHPARREQQALAWMWERIETGLKSAFRAHPGVRAQLPGVAQAVVAGNAVPSAAARQLLNLLFEGQAPGVPS